MHDLHVIQGPNVTRDAREKIAFFAFHAFVVEDSRFRQNRVRTKLYNCGACVCKSNVEIRIAGSFCRPQWEKKMFCEAFRGMKNAWVFEDSHLIDDIKVKCFETINKCAVWIVVSQWWWNMRFELPRSLYWQLIITQTNSDNPIKKYRMGWGTVKIVLSTPN